MRGRAARAVAATVSLALGVVLMPGGGPASGQVSDPPALSADPHTVFDAQLPVSIRFTATGFTPSSAVSLSFADQTLAGTTDGSGVAVVDAVLGDDVDCDSQDSSSFTAVVTQGSGEFTQQAQTEVVLVCAEYDLAVELDPASTTVLADVEFRPEPASWVSQDLEGSFPLERAPDVLVCVTVADAGGALDATGTPVVAGSVVPPSPGAAESGRVSAVESRVLTSRQTLGTTSTTAPVSLRPHEDDVCYEVEHTGATSDEQGTVSYSAVLDLSVVGESRLETAGPQALTVVDSRLVELDPPCAPGGDASGLVVAGSRWQPGDHVVVTADADPVTGLPYDAVVGPDGTFAVDLGAFSAGPGTTMISAVVRRWFDTGTDGELVDVAAQQAALQVPCEPPQLVATPEEVLFSSGQDPLVDVVLTGFAPNAAFDLSGSPLGVGPVLDATGLPASPVTDSAGGFTGKVAVLGPACVDQPLMLTASSKTAQASDAVRLRCVPGVPPPPTLGVVPSPAAYTPGQRPFDVHGAGFAPGPVTLLLDGALAGVGVAGPTGVLEAGFTRTGLPCGDHVVEGVQPTRSASAVLTITCPLLVADPSVLHSAAPPVPGTLTGTGFDPGVPVRLVTELGVETTVTADASGAFSAPLLAGDLPCGPSVVVAVEDVPLPVPPTAEAPVEVRCAALLVRPSVAATGTTVLVEGTGFPDSAQVRLTWQLESLRAGLGTTVATADSSGRFTTRFLILPKDQVGPRNVVGTTDSGGGVSVVSAPVLAVPSSLQPGRPKGVDIARRALLGRR